MPFLLLPGKQAIFNANNKAAITADSKKKNRHKRKENGKNNEDSALT